MSNIEYRWEFSRLRVKDAPGAPSSITSLELTVSAWEDGFVGVYSREVRLGDPDPEDFTPFPESPEDVPGFLEELKAWCLAEIGCDAEYLEQIALADLSRNRLQEREVALPVPQPVEDEVPQPVEDEVPQPVEDEE